MNGPRPAPRVVGIAFVALAIGACATAPAERSGDDADAGAQAYLERMVARLRVAPEIATRVALQLDDSAEIRLRIPTGGVFGIDTAILEPRVLVPLTRIATVLRQYDRTMLELVGYTDSFGSRAYNEEFSRQRAQAIAERLIADGVDAQRITVRGAGEAEALSDNRSAAGRQLNRRVEIVIRLRPPSPRAVS